MDRNYCRLKETPLARPRRDELENGWASDGTNICGGLGDMLVIAAHTYILHFYSLTAGLKISSPPRHRSMGKPSLHLSSRQFWRMSYRKVQLGSSRWQTTTRWQAVEKFRQRLLIVLCV